MTAPTDQFIDITRRSQDALATVARAWAESVQSLTDNVSPNGNALPDVQAYLDSYFDFAERLLANHRELAHQWVSAAVHATEAVTEQASRATKSVSAHTANGAEALLERGAEAARATGEATAATARAARGAAKG